MQIQIPRTNPYVLAFTNSPTLPANYEKGIVLVKYTVGKRLCKHVIIYHPNRKSSVALFIFSNPYSGSSKKEDTANVRRLTDLRNRLHGWIRESPAYKKGSIPQDIFDEYVSQGVEYMSRHLKNSTVPTFTSIFPIHFNKTATTTTATEREQISPATNKYFNTHRGRGNVYSMRNTEI